MVRSDGRRLTPVATNGDPPDCESLPFLPNQRHNFRRARTRNFEYQLSVRACVRVCACASRAYRVHVSQEANQLSAKINKEGNRFETLGCGRRDPSNMTSNRTQLSLPPFSKFFRAKLAREKFVKKLRVAVSQFLRGNWMFYRRRT